MRPAATRDRTLAQPVTRLQVRRRGLRNRIRLAYQRTGAKWNGEGGVQGATVRGPGKRKSRKTGGRGAASTANVSLQQTRTLVPPRFGGGRRWGMVAAGLVLLPLVCYLPAMLWGGLIWDDRIWSRAPAVLEWSGLFTIWFKPSLIEGEAHYWPLVYTTFWLEHKIWGLAPAGYHVVNVVLHVANTLLLWRVLCTLAAPGAALAAALFAVHPLHVESVAWIIERKDLLSALFYLSAVLVWLRFLERPLWRYYGFALLLFAAALLSKSIAVTLPAALLIIQWWREGRIAGRDLLRLAPFFLLGFLITAGDLAFYASRELGFFDYSFVERLLIASRALWFYAGKLAWPAELAVIYPLWDVSVRDPWAWLYLAAALALAASLWFMRRRLGRGPLAGAVFFAVTLSPTLGFVDFTYMKFSFVADRFQYLAGIGLIAVVAGAASVSVSNLSERWGRANRPFVAALPVAVLLLLLGMRSWQHSEIYRDELVFNSYIIAHNPRARGAHRNLSAELFKLGRTEEALEHARIAAQQYPDCVDCHAGVGAALTKLMRLDEAEKHMRRALELDPHNESALQNASELFRLLGRHEEGIAAARAWLKLRPNASGPHQSLARLLAGLDRQAEAERHWRRAHEIDPLDIVVVHNLAESIRKQERYEEALEWYRAAIAAQPDLAMAHAASGHVLFHLARYGEAIEALKRALDLEPDLPNAPSLLVKTAKAAARLGRRAEAAEYYARVAERDPGFAQALFNQALQDTRLKRYDQALEAFETVVKIAPGYAAAHSNLGTVLYHLGRVEEALASFDRALSIDPDFEDARNNRQALTRQRQRDDSSSAP